MPPALQDKVATIRPATDADMAALVGLGLAFVRESVYAQHVAENPAQIERLIAYLLDAPMAMILVAEHEGVIQGFIGLAVVPHLFSGVLTAGELAFYVAPAARGSVGIRLMRAAEQWAASQGAQAISMIAPTARAGALYTRMGYAPLETNFTKRI